MLTADRIEFRNRNDKQIFPLTIPSNYAIKLSEQEEEDVKFFSAKTKILLNPYLGLAEQVEVVKKKKKSSFRSAGGGYHPMTIIIGSHKFL